MKLALAAALRSISSHAALSRRRLGGDSFAWKTSCASIVSLLNESDAPVVRLGESMELRGTERGGVAGRKLRVFGAAGDSSRWVNYSGIVNNNTAQSIEAIKHCLLELGLCLSG